MPNWVVLVTKVMADYSLILYDPPPCISHIPTPIQIDHNKPWAYYDGSTQEQGYGGGTILHLNHQHSFSMLIAFRKGSNNSVELLSTKHIIQFALEKIYEDLQLFGDSKIICDCLIRKARCSTIALIHILDETLRIITSFDSFTWSHIYREQNKPANNLSKEVVIREQGIWLIRQCRGDDFYQYFHRPLMDLNV